MRTWDVLQFSSNIRNTQFDQSSPVSEYRGGPLSMTKEKKESGNIGYCIYYKEFSFKYKVVFFTPVAYFNHIYLFLSHKFFKIQIFLNIFIYASHLTYYVDGVPITFQQNVCCNEILNPE